MQLKPEALNALKLPVKVKAGFLGSVKLKVRGYHWFFYNCVELFFFECCSALYWTKCCEI